MFTKEETEALLQIIDAGVRATGLQHAANAAFLAAKLQAPFKAAVASGETKALVEPEIPPQTKTKSNGHGQSEPAPSV